MMWPGPGSDQDSRERFQCTTCHPPVPSPRSTAVVFTTTESPTATDPVSCVSTYARSGAASRSTSTRCKPARSSRMRDTFPVLNAGTEAKLQPCEGGMDGGSAGRHAGKDHKDVIKAKR